MKACDLQTLESPLTQSYIEKGSIPIQVFHVPNTLHEVYASPRFQNLVEIYTPSDEGESQIADRYLTTHIIVRYLRIRAGASRSRT